MRVVPFIMPSTRIISAPSALFTVFETPADDESTSTYIVIHGSQAIDRKKMIALLGLEDPAVWSESDCEFRPSWVNGFGQDRSRMRENWSGLCGVEHEDAIVALSMGAIFDRSKEHLVPADRAVIYLRHKLLEAARTVDAGGDPVGVGLDLTDVRAPDAMLAGDSNWRELVAHHGIAIENGRRTKELILA